MSNLLFISQRLDYETRKAYTFKIEASNAALDHRFLHLGPFKDTATVKVNVLDVEEPPVFSRPSYSMEMYEDTPIGIIVGAVTAEDLDVGNSPVRYADGTLASVFTLKYVVIYATSLKGIPFRSVL